MDDPALAWNLWWVKYALLDLNQSPFACDYMFYPIGINLTFFTLTVLNAVLSIPLQAVFGIIPTNNIILLSSYVLGGFGAYLLVRYLLARRGAACCARSGGVAPFIAGLIYAFSANKLLYAALGQFNIASSQWIPYYVLFLYKTVDNPRRVKYPLLAALFIVLQAWAELTYASFLIVFTALFFVYHLTDARHFPKRRTLLNFIIVGVVFIIGISPFLYLMITEMRVEGDFLMEGQGFAGEFSADALGFFVPSHLHPTLGRVTDYFNFPARPNRNFVFIGYTALALVVYALVITFRRKPHNVGALRATPFWGFAFVVFVLISLGPALRVNGRAYDLPLPFDVLLQLPFFKGNRYPSRYSVMIGLCVAVLAGYALVQIGQSANWQMGKRKRGEIEKEIKKIGGNRARSLSPISISLAYLRIVLIAGLIVFEHLSIPLPLSDLRVPEVYNQIAADAGDFAVLELPLAWRNGFRLTGTPSTMMMYEQFYQTTHHKRILGGNTSRNSEFKFQYFTEAPIINSLIALETGNEIAPDIRARDKTLAPDVLRFFNARYVVIHTQAVPPDIVHYVEDILPVKKVREENDIIVYQTTLPEPPTEIALTPSSVLNGLYVGEGWGPTAAWRDGHIWAQRRTVRLQIPQLQVGSRASCSLSFRAYVPGAGQIMRVSINGYKSPPVEMRAGWDDYEITIPAASLTREINRVQLQFARLYPIADVRLSARAIGETGVAAPVNILAQSAGNEVGDFSHLYVNGVDYAPNRRGYNIIVINPQSGAVESAASFDTHADWHAAQALSDFIADVPTGHIVVAAVKDEAADVLRDYSVKDLRTIGAAVDLRGKSGWSHAVVGVKMVAPGQAAEDAALIRPAQVWVGEVVTEPQVAAAFAYIRCRDREER